MKNDLGSRMKEYEAVSKHKLVRRVPVIIRLDGKAFHTFTKGFDRPFDELLKTTMQKTTADLCKNIQGCKIGYTQSDEISLLLTDYESIDTDAWFDNSQSKMETISSSMATLFFNKHFNDEVELFKNNYENNTSLSDEEKLKYSKLLNVYKKKLMTAIFDSRARNYPKDEVVNYFIWRQQDATRNSIQMVGQFYFNDTEMKHKNTSMVQEMLFSQHGINWNNYPVDCKRGACIIKETYILEETKAVRSRWVTDKETPIFSQDRDYISKYL